ncbi:hypothetical protein N9J19_00365 [bacterium]|nr:hypothetical protein [bacterium]
MENITRGTWYSPDRLKSIKIKTTYGSYYNVLEYNKKTKNTQELKVGKEGFNQFINELVQNKWTHSHR